MKTSLARSKMFFRAAIILWVILIAGACAPTSAPPASLSGTFRTREAVTGKESPSSLFWQYRFLENGVVEISFVEKSGRDVGRPHERVHFALEGRNVKMRPMRPLAPDVLFCAAALTCATADRLLVEGSDAVLVRVNE